MKDIGNQLLLKWARLGADNPIGVTDDFTRLTLDTIALCAMDFRFNSFYQDKMHPFVDAMLGFLSESGKRLQRPAVMTSLMKGKDRKLKADVDFMDQVAKELVRHRKENPTNEPDLLNAMIKGADSKSGDTMRDELIMANMITFLIAGTFYIRAESSC
jgi:cytochrome P450/NADPH-cytochrome P450 reductase